LLFIINIPFVIIIFIFVVIITTIRPLSNGTICNKLIAEYGCLKPIDGNYKNIKNQLADE